MNEFRTYHPIVNFAYFVIVIGFSCFVMHPICLGISFASALTYSAVLKGRKTIASNLKYMLPAAISMAVINPAFNHEGITIMAYMPGGNPLTAESVIYGLCSAVMILSVICFFGCYNEVMTSDKFIYLFGRIMPSVSLVISMTLRFVPMYVHQLKEITQVQKCMGCDISKGSIITRAKNGLKILSVLTTRSLENTVETADSMKSRGYGIPGRTSFSVFTFDKRDKYTLICIIYLTVYTLTGVLNDGIYFRFYPSVKMSGISLYTVSVYASYLMLCMFPVIIEIREAIKWKSSRSKI